MGSAWDDEKNFYEINMSLLLYIKLYIYYFDFQYNNDTLVARKFFASSHLVGHCSCSIELDKFTKISSKVGRSLH